MAHTVEVVISVRVDGVQSFDFPLIGRLQVEQVIPLGFKEPPGGSYVNLADRLSTLQFAIVKADSALKVRANDQSDSYVPVNASGIYALFDVTVDTGDLLSILNLTGPEAVDINLTGILGGFKA